MKKGLSIYALDTSGYLAVPYAEDGVQAGFPSPATDIIAYTSDGELKLMRKEAAGDIAGLSVWGVLTAVIKINRESVYWDIVPEDILPEEISKLK